jgi:hypothetical protein
MPKLCSSLFLPALLAAASLHAQQPVRLVQPAAILQTERSTNDRHLLAAMQAAGFDQVKIDRILASSDPMTWPEGLRTDSARMANASPLEHAAAFRMLDIHAGDWNYVLVQIPAAFNTHLPEGVRNRTDIHLLIQPEGLAEVTAPKPKASKGPNWRAMPKARIKKPEELFATYDLSMDVVGLDVLAQHGLSEPEIEAVVFRSHERNWPDGIDSFAERHPRLKQFRRFKAHVAAQWEDKVLLVIPAELNTDLPPALRPYLDIYMVYSRQAVTLLK